MKLNILNNSIFDKSKIISGVTKINNEIFPNSGLSFSKKSINDKSFNQHLSLFATFIGYNERRLKYINQIHSNNIIIVDENSSICDADAMITKVKNIILLIKIADCAGILLYDPIKEVIAAVHSGWKGTSLNILGLTIQKMYELYNCNAMDLLVYISPCASGDNYEVEYDVAKLFPNSTKQINFKKFTFDNRHELLLQLNEMNVLSKNIEVSDICTIQNSEYHSYRRDKENSGRMGLFIGMK